MPEGLLFNGKGAIKKGLHFQLRCIFTAFFLIFFFLNSDLYKLTRAYPWLLRTVAHVDVRYPLSPCA